MIKHRTRSLWWTEHQGHLDGGREECTMSDRPAGSDTDDMTGRVLLELSPIAPGR